MGENSYYYSVGKNKGIPQPGEGNKGIPRRAMHNTPAQTAERRAKAAGRSRTADLLITSQTLYH